MAAAVTIVPRHQSNESWTIPAEPPSANYAADKEKRPRVRRQLLQALRLSAKPAFLAIMGLTATAAFLAMLTVHEALSVAINMSASRASLSLQPQQQQQQLDRLVDTVPHRLLLATHNVLAWYYPEYDTLEQLHRGEGVHYGLFPGEPLPGHPHTLWNVIRPHNWRPSAQHEYLVQLDADTGAELDRVEIPARFSHDAIRVGHRVYVCSTGDGTILELSYPDMALLRKMRLFSETDHPNTLAAAAAGPVVPGGSLGGQSPDHLWVMLHNLGPSDLVKVYVGPNGPAREVVRIKNIGRKAHGLVAWGKRGELILLDSDNAVLVSLDPKTGDEVELWQVPEHGKFLKGLAVLDDIAYFGITTWSHRSVRDSPDSHGELAAFDLMKNKLLWRRVVHTSGLLNVIGTPHLAPDSTYVATYTHTPVPATMLQASRATAPPNRPAEVTEPVPGSASFVSHFSPLRPLVLPDSQAMVDAAVAHLAASGHSPPRLGPTNYWSSGWPRLDIAPKLTTYPEAGGLQLPLFHADISALKAKLLAMPPAMWTKEEQASSNVVMNGRNSNMERFKPGVEGIVLLFSDNNAEVVYQFPYYDYFRAELEPLLHEILGPADALNIVRIQLALMKPGTSDIKLHVDSGGYAKRGHHIHVPLITHPHVSFDMCPQPAEAAAAAVAVAHDTPPSAAVASALKRVAVAVAAPQPANVAADVLDAVLDDDDSGSHAAAGSSRWWWLQPKHKQPQHQTQQQQHQTQQQQQLVPAPRPRSLQAQQQRSQQQQFASLDPQTCVKIPAPEGFVFELNNRVQHKVANPGPGPRVHLVVDVFEEYRPRTLVPPGSVCEYGGQLTTLQQVSTIMQLALQDGMDEEQLASEIQLLLATAGMSCRTPDQQRILPQVTPADAESLAQRAAQQQALIDALLTGMQLQGHPPQGYGQGQGQGHHGAAAGVIVERGGKQMAALQHALEASLQQEVMKRLQPALAGPGGVQTA